MSGMQWEIQVLGSESEVLVKLRLLFRKKGRDGELSTGRPNVERSGR